MIYFVCFAFYVLCIYSFSYTCIIHNPCLPPFSLFSVLLYSNVSVFCNKNAREKHQYCMRKRHDQPVHLHHLAGAFSDRNIQSSPLSRIPRDSLKHFEISVPRHIRSAEMRKTINQTAHLTNEYEIWLLKLEIYWKYCGKEEQFLLFFTIFITCC